MTPIDWTLLPLKKYAIFSGRAPRAEYWWYILATSVIGFGVDFIDGKVGGPLIGLYGPLSLVFTIGFLVPGVAVTVRRLHDIGRSGWWILLNSWSYAFIIVGFSRLRVQDMLEGMNPAVMLLLVLLMLVCIVVLFVFAVTQGNEGANQYGPDPYGPGELEEVFA